MTGIFLLLNLSIIEGRVLDKETQKPLDGVNIVIDKTPLGTQSEKDGGFYIDGIKKGEYLLISSRVGYKPESLKVNVVEDKSYHLEIYLVPSPVEIPEIIIKGKKIKKTRGNYLMLNKEEIKSIPGAEKDIFRAVQSLPGVGMPSDLIGHLYIRGGESRENLYLLDGIEVFNPFHFYGMASVFNTEMVKNIFFSRGGFGPEYGNVLSSVVEITSTNKVKGINGKVGIDLTETDLFYSSTFTNNTSLMIGARISYLDKYLQKIGVEEGTALPRYRDIQTKLGFTKNSFSLFLTGLRSTEDVKAYTAIPGFESLLKWENENRLLGVLINTSLFFDLKIYLSRTESKNYFYMKHYKESSKDMKIKKSSMKIEVSRREDFFSWKAGSEITYLDYFYKSSIPEEILHIEEWDFTLSADTTAWMKNAYILFKYKPEPRLYAGFGIRYDNLSLLKKSSISPRLFVAKKFKKTEAKFMWGIYHMFPPIEYLNYPNEISPEPSPLQPELSRHYILEIKRNISNTVYLELSFYYKKYSNLIVWFENKGEGESKGVELMLRKAKDEGFFGWVSLSISESKRSFLTTLEKVPSDGDQPFIFNLFISKKFLKDIIFGVKIKCSSGAPYTPLLGKEWGEYDWTVKLGKHNSARLPFYKRVDLKIEKKFMRKKGIFYLSILNLFNTKNIQAYLYNEDFTQKTPLYMLPRIISTGIEIKI